MLIVIVVGGLAGLVTAYQGIRTTAEKFDRLKFFDGVLMAIIGAVPLAVMASYDVIELNVFGYVIIFFAAIGVGVQITKTRKKTIPSLST